MTQYYEGDVKTYPFRLEIESDGELKVYSGTAINIEINENAMPPIYFPGPSDVTWAISIKGKKKPLTHGRKNMNATMGLTRIRGSLFQVRAAFWNGDDIADYYVLAQDYTDALGIIKEKFGADAQILAISCLATNVLARSSEQP